jgi:hypothetical protein
LKQQQQQQQQLMDAYLEAQLGVQLRGQGSPGGSGVGESGSGYSCL